MFDALGALPLLDFRCWYVSLCEKLAPLTFESNVRGRRLSIRTEASGW